MSPLLISVFQLLINTSRILETSIYIVYGFFFVTDNF